jgi:DNA-binding transcriptional LysR family regulator
LDFLHFIGTITHRLNWDDIRHFLKVVRSGSAAQGTIRLDVNHTAIYRRISALEDRLGKRLFERSNVGWVITPVGERIVAYAESTAKDAYSIERQVLADSQELRGLLRVTAADHRADRRVMPAIPKFVGVIPR